MTREEAINKLNWALDNNTIEDVQSAYEYIIALKMAIQALEQEPTTKNDLGVDTNKLLADCEKMSFDIEIFNKPLKVVALDAVKNIAKDLIRKTPNKSEILTDSTTKNDLAVDLISREDVLMCLTGEFENREYEPSELIKIFSKRIKELPSVTPQEPILDKVRAEVTALESHHINDSYDDGFQGCRIEVLDILNKYKADIEP